MKPDRIVIDWNYSGKPDEFFGTGATVAERALVWTVGLFATGLLGWVVWSKSIPWTVWQYLVAGLLALDVFGGVVANALNSCKRFYHAPLQPEETGLTRLAKNHLLFTALHIHPLLVGFLFGGSWTYGLFWYLALVLSALVLLQMPLYLQRPAALGIILIAILLNLYILPPVWGFEWLIPALFLKIVYGHLVREEPYRP
jgi:hypothetical protein